jgi:hypothetical protein
MTYGAAVHFGKQVRKERLAKHWSLRQFTAESGIDVSTASQTENGLRPPNERVAIACDKVFPHRDGWFLEYYFDSLVGIPPGLRSWQEHEDKAVRLDVWVPGVVDGLFQTVRYAEALLRTSAGVTEEQVQARLAARVARRDRVLNREGRPPEITYVVDHVALLRLTGSPEIMAEQCAHLLELADRPNITLIVLPVVAHPASESGLIIADHSAAYTGYIKGGAVYIEPDRVEDYDRTMTAIKAECYRASDSAAIVRNARELWTGVSQATAGQTARNVSRWLRGTE